MFEKLFTIIGHFHPALVHIPIGTLILTYILYRVNGRSNRRNMRHAINIGLFCSSVAALVSVLCGLLLARNGDYDTNTLGWHKYLGFTVTIISIFLWYTHQDIYKRDHSLTGSMFKTIFNLGMIALVVGGHLGGTLTHGKGYLFKAAGKNTAPLNMKPAMINSTERSDQKVYSEIIQPIFNDKCISCHNPEKKKGGLILSDSKGLLAGGKDGLVIELGNPEGSVLYDNIMKPIEDDTHMPPDGKRQLSETEKKLIVWWIKNHKSFEDKVSDFPPFEGIIHAKNIDPIKNTIDFDWSEIPVAEGKTINQLQALGFKIYGLAQNNPLLDVAYSFKKNLDKKAINHLQKINQQTYTLDLSSSNLNDELFESIGSLPNLVSLNLNNTEISDKSLARLDKFPRLKKLNVYQTKITDAGLPALKGITTLKSVYIWQTGISESGLAQFKQSNPNLDIVSGIRMDTLVRLKLPKPTIRTETDLFYDSTKIEMASFFKDANLRYTLDGTVPGPTSNQYTQPIFVHQTVDIRLIAYKEGWESSDTATRVISKAGFKIKEVVLAKDPVKRYQADGGATLIDLNKGVSAGDGKWLAYQKDDFIAQVQLEQPQTVSKVKISTLQNPGLWAYYPKGLEIQWSTDGNKYQTITRSTYPTPKKNEPGGLKVIELSFKPVEASYLKVILKNQGKNPFWHAEKGKPSWVFCDEIIVE